MTEERLKEVERDWEGNQSSGGLEGVIIYELIAEVRRLQGDAIVDERDCLYSENQALRDELRETQARESHQLELVNGLLMVQKGLRKLLREARRDVVYSWVATSSFEEGECGLLTRIDAALGEEK